MMVANQDQTDYDNAWKQAIVRYFQDFIALFFPEVHAGVNWQKDYVFLDTELQQIVRDAELGKRLVDKLVKVHRKNGQEAFVLVHTEIQAQIGPDFSKRMYTYNYRIFDRYDRQVVSLAVLADQNPNWKPKGYGYGLWGCRVSLEFPMVKLLDFEWSALEESSNPFSIIVMAHLKAQATRQDDEGRCRWKLALLKML